MEDIPKDLADLDTCHSLFLCEIGEPEQNCLRLLIEDAFVLPQEATIRFGNSEITGGRPVESTENSRLFEVTWNNYVAYNVANESYSTRTESEEFSGRLARLYSKSHFLEYISRATLVSKEYPGPLRHVQIICECHIVDAVSTEFPQVRLRQSGPSLHQRRAYIKNPR